MAFKRRRADDDGGTAPGVLFLCVANSARSQMAEGLFRHLTLGRIPVWSAGSSPRDVHPLAITAMAESGINIELARSKDISQVPMERVACIVTLCSEEVCPRVPAKVEIQRWPMLDPTQEGDLRGFRRVRDEIEAKIKAFLREHKIKL